MRSSLHPVSRRELLAAGTVPAVAGGPGAVFGPLVGHTDPTSTFLWARFLMPGRHAVMIRAAAGGLAVEASQCR